ncbi:MAG: hypothetical protein H7250_07865 [Flavobacterium sp.]|nr:hypothetical protein [Flavobacterium sp.]
MQEFHQTVKVKNHVINITLPDHFDCDEVEVFVLKKEKNDFEIPQFQIDEVRERHEKYLKNPDNVISMNDFLKELENDL